MPFITEKPVEQDVYGPDGIVAAILLPGNYRHAEQVANARLIAASPTLLAALERLVACPDVSLCEVEQETYDALNQAREAIAAATGE